jgi:hypothetical protein
MWSLLLPVNNSLFRSLVFWRQYLSKVGQSTGNYEGHIIYLQATIQLCNVQFVEGLKSIFFLI